MDERHWWMAQKIQQTFPFLGGSTNLESLKEFILEPGDRNILALMTSFLAADGASRLFFYCRQPPAPSAKVLCCTQSLASLDVSHQRSVRILHFLKRPPPPGDGGDPLAPPERRTTESGVLCGEVKQNVVDSISTIFCNIFVPLLRSQKSWGKCSKATILRVLDDYEAIFGESKVSIHGFKQMVLKQPETMLLCSSCQPQRVAPLEPSIIAYYEDLLADWISSIDEILNDTTSNERMMDPTCGLLPELDKCKRRYQLLINITEQLKSKVSKGVIGILITARSKMLKKWKFVDAEITDALNEFRDKMKYMESFKKYLKRLEKHTKPEIIVNIIIPGIMKNIKLMESQSRFYAKSGFLGQLMTKICYQVMLQCKEYIYSYTILEDGKDELWQKVSEEIKHFALISDSPSKSLKARIIKFKGKMDKLKTAEISFQDSNLHERLHTCLIIQIYIEDVLKSIKESLFPTKETNNHIKIWKDSLSLMQKPLFTCEIDGVNITNRETVMSYMNSLCSRIHEVLDIFDILVQYHKVIELTRRLPRIRKEVIEFIYKRKERESFKQIKFMNDAGKDVADGDVSQDDCKNSDAKLSNEIQTEKTSSDTCILRRWYAKYSERRDSSVSWFIGCHVKYMTKVLQSNVTSKTMLSTKSKDEFAFTFYYKQFLDQVKDVEQFIVAYLNIVFQKRIKTIDALNILTKFSPIKDRSELKDPMFMQHLNIFKWYADDLETLQLFYEKHKEKAFLVRNAPPMAGTIYWIQFLLKKIEEPMLTFKNIKAVTQHSLYMQLLPKYNDLVNALHIFEEQCLTKWKSTIDEAKQGLQAPLLSIDVKTKEIVVNIDDRVKNVLHEAKWLTRAGIKIPEAAAAVLRQESRLKTHKMRLETCILECKRANNCIPQIWKKLFQSYLEQLQHKLQLGLQTLTWECVNIDAFLFQIHEAVIKVENFGKILRVMIASHVENKISEIEKLDLFDVTELMKESQHPEKWKVKMLNSISERSNILKTYVLETQKGLQSVMETLEKKIDLSLIYSSNGQMELQKGHIMWTEKDIVKEILDVYRKKIKLAIVKSTVKSLQMLGTALGCSEECSVEDDLPLVFKTSKDFCIVNLNQSELPACHSLEIYPEYRTTMQNYFRKFSDSLDFKPLLQFDVLMKFKIPYVIMDPPLESIYSTFIQVLKAIVTASKGIQFFGVDENYYYEFIQRHRTISRLVKPIINRVEEYRNDVMNFIIDLRCYHFLWKKNVHESFREFMSNNPSKQEMENEVEHLMEIENNILQILPKINIGFISFCTLPVVDALHGLALSWKTTYASILHQDVKTNLYKCLKQRETIKKKLRCPINTLEMLSSTLNLLDQVRDMENKIDDIYLPIETMYDTLERFSLRLPRQEVEDVKALRDHWTVIMEMADKLQQHLLLHKRVFFEQELDKENKVFVIAVIQFRNKFDAEGPNAPDISFEEAISRLAYFDEVYQKLKVKKQTIDSIAKILGIIIKSFPELDRSGEELSLLKQLYKVFQNFHNFDLKLRNTLWSDLDIKKSLQEVESHFNECVKLPTRLEDWPVYQHLKSSLHFYKDVFPFLAMLAAEGIKSRHWLQVMHETGNSFQLESSVFKLGSVLDIDLLRHKIKIEEICFAASKELELEMKMRLIEETWAEQILTFELFRISAIVLNKPFTEQLLEQLEDAQITLANMLKSRYIDFMREEAASWAVKLKYVAYLLNLWMDVQELWLDLHAVFSNHLIIKEMPNEAKRFLNEDKAWTKIMKKAVETKNVLQFCLDGEVSKSAVFHHMQKQMEICFKSLSGYLDKKRNLFPRFYFVSNIFLLAILGRANDLDCLKVYFRSLFSHIYNVEVERNKKEDNYCETSSGRSSYSEFEWSLSENPENAIERMQLFTKIPDVPEKSSSKVSYKKSLKGSSIKGLKRYTTSKKEVQKSRIFSNTKSSQQHFTSISSLLSNFISSDETLFAITAVTSFDGEMLVLDEKVKLERNVEQWLQPLRLSVGSTLKRLVLDAFENSMEGDLESFSFKYPTQVCNIAMLYYWSKECHQAIQSSKTDEKNFQIFYKKFNDTGTRLTGFLLKGSKKNSGTTQSARHQKRLERMVSQFSYLREILENLSNKRVRDHMDFEWRRTIKCQLISLGDIHEPCLTILNKNYVYGSEFYGTEPTVIITPLTEKCFLSISIALDQLSGIYLIGPRGVGKTSTIKGLASLLAYYVKLIYCCKENNAAAYARILQGVANDGCWLLLHEAEKLSKGSLAVTLDYTNRIMNMLRLHQSCSNLSAGHEVYANKSLALFLTITPNPNKTSEFSKELRGFFRCVTMIKPDETEILKAECYAMGLKMAPVFAERLKMIATLANDQFTGSANRITLRSLKAVLRRAHQLRRLQKFELSDSKLIHAKDKSRSGITSRSFQNRILRRKLTADYFLKLETGHILQAFDEVISSGIEQEFLPMLQALVECVFPGAKDTQSVLKHSYDIKKGKIERAIYIKAEEEHSIVNQLWIDKCLQLYSVSQVQHCIAVAGPPASGKSSCIQTLISALCTVASSKEKMHKLFKVNPLVVDDLSLMFGSVGENQNWLDGIFTSLCKRASRNISITWLCLDGPFNSSWMQNITSFLEPEKTLLLWNGDQICLSENVYFLFETDYLGDIDPHFIGKIGVVYIDSDVVGWVPIAKSWLKTKAVNIIHVLHRAIDNTVNVVMDFIQTEASPILKLPEIGMLHSCLMLLSAILADNQEISGERHIEKLYLFCLLWTFGGILNIQDREAFCNLLKKQSSVFPDDDNVDLFDLYVDESGEWKQWSTKFEEENEFLNDRNESIVKTVEMIRIQNFIQLAAASEQHVLLVGPRGSGKTSVILDFLNSQDPQSCVYKRIVYSAATASQKLQEFIESNIHHRQGFVYGARYNRKFNLFINDISIPRCDEYGVQKCNELLRQILDDKAFYTTQKPFELKYLEELCVFSTLNTDDVSRNTNSQFSAPRLLRHFVVLMVSKRDEADMRLIAGKMLERIMGEKGLAASLHQKIVNASCQLLHAVQSVLHLFPIPGRCHYFFNLKNLETCFQCLNILSDEMKEKEDFVVSFWVHEIQRTFQDNICRHSDSMWFDQELSHVIAKNWPKRERGSREYFTTIRTSLNIGEHYSKKIIRKIDRLSDLYDTLHNYRTRYNEGFGNKHLSIQLSDTLIFYILKVHRVLSYHENGNMLIVGPAGMNITSLCILACEVAHLPFVKIRGLSTNAFFDGLRSTVRQAGSEGKALALILTEDNLEEPSHLDAINNLLSSGNCPLLFSADEMEDLLQAVVAPLKKQDPEKRANPMKFFMSEVNKNLHILICLPTNHHILKTGIREYPSLLRDCEINWLDAWSDNPQIKLALYCLNSVIDSEEQKVLNESIALCAANINSYMLKECNQNIWTGDTAPFIQIPVVKYPKIVTDKKKQESPKLVMETVPNFPYTKSILLDAIRFRHRNFEILNKQKVYVSPTAFQRFLYCFRYLYKLKSKQREQEVATLTNVLTKLEKTKIMVNMNKKTIKETIIMHDAAKECTARLLQKLTEKARDLEKLKAKINTKATNIVCVNVTAEAEDDELLKEVEYDVYDEQFDKMREEAMKSQQEQAQIQLVEIKEKYEEHKEEIKFCKSDIVYWLSKTDRACIDNVKSFSAPSFLVGQVLNMFLILLRMKIPLRRLEFSNLSCKTGHFSKMSLISSTKSFSIRVKRELPNRLDRTTWKNMQSCIGNSSNFIEMLKKMPWKEGLPDKVIQAATSFLDQKELTRRKEILSYMSDSKTFQEQEPCFSKKIFVEDYKGITVSAAKHTSRELAILVCFSISIISYSNAYKKMKATQKRIKELEKEIEENELKQKRQEEESKVEEEMSDEDVSAQAEQFSEDKECISHLLEELALLQEEFNNTVIERNELENSLQNMNKRVKAASILLESFQTKESEWRKYVEENDSNPVLISNCIIASAFLSYCGLFSFDNRNQLGIHFSETCKHYDLPESSKKLFENMKLIDFLQTPLQKVKLEVHLLSTNHVLDNACFIKMDQSWSAWPLICDMNLQAVDWIRLYLRDTDLVEVRLVDLKSQLEYCLVEGHKLLIKDCDSGRLLKDTRFTQIFQSCKRFFHEKTNFKIEVGSNEIECHSNFRLYLHTTEEPHLIPAELIAKVNVIVFNQSRQCIEKQLLNRFSLLEKSRFTDRRTSLQMEKEECIELLFELEEQMIQELVGNDDLLKYEKEMNRLSQIKRQYDETEGRITSIKNNEENLQKAQVSYHTIAKRGALCFDVMQYLREINPIYRTSFPIFLKVFDHTVSLWDRSSVKDVIDKLTYQTFVMGARPLNEHNRLVYALVLAIEIEDSEGRVNMGEREFLISPQYANIVMSSMFGPPEPKILSMTKPFDWMSDEQFYNLQLLGGHFRWFKEMLEKINKDGNEIHWRALCEIDVPETYPLPDKKDNDLTALQRLCVIRALRSDRIIQASTLFVTDVLDKRFCDPDPFNLRMILLTGGILTPIFLLYHDDALSAQRMFYILAEKIDIKTQFINITDEDHPAVLKSIKMGLYKGMEEGAWVLLHNAHYAPSMIDQLISWLQKYPEPNKQFKCWLSFHADYPKSLPVALHSSVKVLADYPKKFKHSILTSFMTMDVNILKCSQSFQWLVTLHNICYLHAAIQLRARMGLGAWNNPRDFKNIDIIEMLETIGLGALITNSENELQKNQLDRNFWNAIHYAVNEIFFGRHISDPHDKETLSAMVEFLLSPSALKKDFEFFKLNYRVPVLFYSNCAKVSAILKALENIPNYLLDSPEGCFMHPSSETLFGEDQYVFTRMNKIYDAMQESDTLKHRLYPRPPNPYDGILFAGISPQTNNPRVACHGVFASACDAIFKMRKEVYLWEICYLLLPKIPKSYKKNKVLDRVKKMGGNIFFNNFFVREVIHFYALLDKIKETIEVLKDATEHNSLQCALSDVVIAAADDLYHMKIPEEWRRMAGYTAPPLTWTMAQWILNLQARYSQYDKILLNGHNKLPVLWLGGLFYPQAFLAIYKQDYMSKRRKDLDSCIITHAEITMRDKEHVKDPHPEGINLSGIHLWGCHWERTTNQIIDLPPKQNPQLLPVVILNFNEKLSGAFKKSQDKYLCPVYPSSISDSVCIFEITIKSNVLANVWALRGITATLQPY